MIKKILVLIMLIFAILPATLATSLEVEKIDKWPVIISELSNPAVYELNINNFDGPQQAQIYSFGGLTFSPRGFFDIETGNNSIEVKAYPSEEIRKQKGSFNIEYEIKGEQSGITKDKISIKVVGLKESLDIKANDFGIDDSKVFVAVKNTQNAYMENIKLHFSSLFFDEEKTISLSPYELENVSLTINKDKVKTLVSGKYLFSVDIGLENAKVNFDGNLNYLPKENVVYKKSNSGLIIRKNVYTKINAGNVPVNARIELTKDILSRLFTMNSVEPMEIKRKALFATYSWEKSLQPNESYSITNTTNYTLPFVLLLFIIIIALLVKIYSRTNIVLTKRVSFVKTKGGEFALKIRLHVKAKKYVENVQVIDRLPGMTKLYEKFGIRPDKIEVATRRLFWNIDSLNAGEERVYSYIIYSRVGVVGRFELPAASALYLRNGQTEQVFSNRTFFVAETTRTDVA